MFARIMVGLAAESAEHKTIMIDATYLKAHRTASSLRVKKGGRAPDRALGLSFVITVIALIVVIWRLIRADAFVDPLLVVAGVGIFLLLVPERQGNERLEDIGTPLACAPDTSCVQTGAGEASPDHRMPIRFALNADGGGIRAALYTAQVLALTDNLTCGEFGRHVFAASGVSGGALGIATWAALRQDYVHNVADSAWAECKVARVRPLVSAM